MDRRTVLALARLLLAALTAAAVVATLVAVSPVSPWNFFGYFTVQSNVIGAVVAAIGAVRLVRGSPITPAWVLVRWCAATYLIVVGLVFWILLAPLGAAGGIPLPWANLVLHAVTPVAALVDLLLAPDRAPPALRSLPVVLGYPLVWTAVVLVRGATDGWVPYPFLDPAQGYGVVAGYVALVAGVITGVAALARLPLLRPALRRGPARSLQPGG
ncbi:Pr6Pr family membrane protein [uncultured Amnibacterium sp.]|uniref:Pr6Pr family membrane protein n=1 Tax=uncultured Amnibacterium sp. TaxID=1631851 RepID=UPI0035C9FEE0